MTIFKYPIEVCDRQTVSIRGPAVILSVQFQAGRLCLWALVDENSTMVEKTIQIYGTGFPDVEIHSKHLGTVQEGRLVWHVFSRT